MFVLEIQIARKPLFRLDVFETRGAADSHDVFSLVLRSAWGICVCVWWRGFLWCDEEVLSCWRWVREWVLCVYPCSFEWRMIRVWCSRIKKSFWCMLRGLWFTRRGRTVGELSSCSVSSQSHQKIRWNARSRETYFFCVDRILSACSSSHYLFAFSLSLIFGVYAAAAVREEDDEKSSKSERRMMSSLCLLSEAST